MDPKSLERPKSHRISLKRIFIEKRAQPFTQAATLTLKDGNSSPSNSQAPTNTAVAAVAHGRFMQIHIDGKTLVSLNQSNQVW